jgi:hypothetical protein
VRSTAPLSVCVLLAACASAPPSAKDLGEVWLAEAPRTIQVRAEPMPQAQVRSHDFRGGSRVGGAVAGAGVGALYTIGGLCVAGGPLGCFVGLYLAPVGAAVGAVAGAVSVKSRESVRSATSDADAQRVLEAGRAADVPAMLVDALLAEQPSLPRHALQRDAAEASWVWRVTTVELVGSAHKEPPLFLKLEAEAQVTSPVAVVTMGPYRYESGYRRADEWIADDGRAIREELARATRSMASSAASALNAGAGSRASARVAAWRRRLLPVEVGVGGDRQGGEHEERERGVPPGEQK